MKFRSKPSRIDAIRYGPAFRPGLVKEVAEFIAGVPLEDREITDWVKPGGPWDPPNDQVEDPDYATILIQAGVYGAQGWVKVPLGHWVVRSVGDLTDHWPVDPDYFTRKYEQEEQT